MTHAIVEAQPCHLRALAPLLRQDDLAEIAAFGVSPMRALMRSWRAAVIRRAGFIDGEIAAVWGVGGSLLSGHGRPWLLTGHAVERAPVQFVKTARSELAAMASIFPYLENRVPVSYSRALSFLAMLGFEIHAPETVGGIRFCRVTLGRA